VNRAAQRRADGGVLELQSRTLLERVRAIAARAIATIEWDTSAQVETLRRAARTEAHAQVRAAVRAKRERVAEHCRKALAEAETRERTGTFAVERELAAHALAALPAALHARWRDGDARRAWCAAAAAVAARSLVALEWEATLAAGATEADLEPLRAAAGARGARLRVQTSGSPPAGLRIAAGGVTVDATPDGLLADRAGVESRVLAAQVARGAR
jgi:hypothetical protein